MFKEYDYDIESGAQDKHSRGIKPATSDRIKSIKLRMGKIEKQVLKRQRILVSKCDQGRRMWGHAKITVDWSG